MSIIMKKTKKPNSDYSVANKKLAHVQKLFAQGTAFHQKGQLDQAQAVYKKIAKTYNDKQTDDTLKIPSTAINLHNALRNIDKKNINF